jgi:hypothetical protein
MIKWAPGSIISFLISLVISGLLFPNPACLAAQKEDLLSEKSGGDKVSRNDIEISVFPTREEAEKLSEKIGNSGFETYVREHKTEDDRTVYGVFVITHTESPQEKQIPSSTGTVETERLVGTKRTPKDILLHSVSIHPGLTVSETYTDNAFSTRTNKKSDLSTVLSPQVWISMPRVNEKPGGLDLIDPRSVGGLSLSRESGEGARRYQVFLMYNSDIPVHSQNSPSGNMVTHNVQGGLSYNFPGGLSIAVNDEFSRYYETTDTSVLVVPGEVDKYNSNLFYALLSYDTGSKVRLRFDYSHFLLSYDAERNALRDRVDNSFSTYLFYKLRPKTSLFFEYAFKDIGYSNDTSLNSKEHNFFLGVEWKITAKSTGSVKAGYSLRNFADSGTNNKTFVFEGKMDHKFTPKTSLTLTASRKTDETNIPSTFFVLTNEFGLNYQQMLTSKITGSLTLGYTNESYGADLTFGGFTAKRKDNIYQLSLGLQYEFRKWLKAGISYGHTIRDSNFPDFNYSSNAVLLRLTGSL